MLLSICPGTFPNSTVQRNHNCFKFLLTTIFSQLVLHIIEHRPPYEMIARCWHGRREEYISAFYSYYTLSSELRITVVALSKSFIRSFFVCLTKCFWTVFFFSLCFLSGLVLSSWRFSLRWVLSFHFLSLSLLKRLHKYTPAEEKKQWVSDSKVVLDITSPSNPSHPLHTPPQFAVQEWSEITVASDICYKVFVIVFFCFVFCISIYKHLCPTFDKTHSTLLW